MNGILFKKTDEKVKKLTERLRDIIGDGYYKGKVYFVGKCVRDMILGEPIDVIDVIVGLELSPTPFVTFLVGKEKNYEAGKNPTFTGNNIIAHFNDDKEYADIELNFIGLQKANDIDVIKEYVKRGDLTIDTLCYNVTEDKIYDFNGKGLYDLFSRIVRTANDPEKTFDETPIAMLNVIKTASMYGWGIEKNTWVSIIKNADKINDASQYLITSGLIDIICTEKPSVGMEKLLYSGLLNEILPDVYNMTKVFTSPSMKETVFQHTLNVMNDVEMEPENRFAALFHEVGKTMENKDKSMSPNQFSSETTEKILRNLRLPDGLIKNVTSAIRHYGWFYTYSKENFPSDKKIKKLINSCKGSVALTFDLMNSDIFNSPLKEKGIPITGILTRALEIVETNDFEEIETPVNGKDLQERFHIKPSPLVGKMLDEIKNQCIENPNITKEECFAVAETVMNSLTY